MAAIPGNTGVEATAGGAGDVLGRQRWRPAQVHEREQHVPLVRRQMIISAAIMSPIKAANVCL